MEAKIETPKFRSWPLLKQITNDYWEEARRARECGRSIAWCSGVSPSDFLSAMDFFIAFPMNESAICGAGGVSTALCQEAEASGYPSDLCSYARTNIGSVLAGEITKSPIGGLPKPDLLLACNNQCVTVTKWFESLSRTLKVPLILIDVPFFHDGVSQDTLNGALDYVRQQLKGLPTFLEEFTGRHFDYDQLQVCIENTGVALRTWKKGLKMRQYIPSPISCFDVYNLLFPILCLRGRREAVDFYEKLNVEIAERVAQGIGAVPGERYRLHLDAPPPWPRIRQLSNKFASVNACVITGIYPLAFGPFERLDPSRPIDSMAEALIDLYIGWGLERRVDTLMKLIDEYHLDGVVMQWAQTCKPCFMTQYGQIEAIERRAGLPCLIIEGDMCDARLYSETETNTRIDTFIEILQRVKREG